MTTRRSFALCLAILFICSQVTTAQQPRRGGRGRSAARSGAPASIPPGPARASASSWSITTQVFAEDGESTTLVSLQPMPTDAAKQSPLNFGVNFTYAGNKPADFRNVALTFFSRAQTCRFAAESAVKLNLDSRPLQLPYRPQTRGADGVFWIERDEEGGDCAETVVAYISPATLARIAAARNVTGSIDKESFQLSANNLGGLRALLAQLKLPQLRNAPPARLRARR